MFRIGLSVVSGRRHFYYKRNEAIGILKATTRQMWTSCYSKRNILSNLWKYSLKMRFGKVFLWKIHVTQVLAIELKCSECNRSIKLRKSIGLCLVTKLKLSYLSIESFFCIKKTKKQKTWTIFQLKPVFHPHIRLKNGQPEH